jgi:hypothetical protein
MLGDSVLVLPCFVCAPVGAKSLASNSTYSDIGDLFARLRASSKVLRQFFAYEQKRIEFTVPGNDGNS